MMVLHGVVLLPAGSVPHVAEPVTTALLRRIEQETKRKLNVLDRLLALGVPMDRALILACIPPSWEATDEH